MTPPDPTRRLLPRLAAAWCRADLPGRTIVARRLARVDDDAFWMGVGGASDTTPVGAGEGGAAGGMEPGVVTIRDRWNRHRLALDPREYFQRWAWLLGRYHEWPLQLLLSRALAPGDTFVDVGANYGLVALHAAHLVGATGRVLAFEPNPDVLRRLEWHVRANGLGVDAPEGSRRGGRITVVPAALGREPGRATLRLASANTGAASLAPLPWAEAAHTTHECAVERGDDRLAALPDAPMFIKIDVEGFECEVLAGLRATLEQRRPAVVCEVNRRCLRAAGAGLGRMLRMMRRQGYCPLLFDARRGVLGSTRLVLTPFTTPPRGLFDLLFLHPDSVHARRLGVRASDPGAAGIAPVRTAEAPAAAPSPVEA